MAVVEKMTTMSAMRMQVVLTREMISNHQIWQRSVLKDAHGVGSTRTQTKMNLPIMNVAIAVDAVSVVVLLNLTRMTTTSKSLWTTTRATIRSHRRLKGAFDHNGARTPMHVVLEIEGGTKVMLTRVMRNVVASYLDGERDPSRHRNRRISLKSRRIFRRSSSLMLMGCVATLKHEFENRSLPRRTTCGVTSTKAFLKMMTRNDVLLRRSVNSN